jgi:Fe2+ transport system protein FeoA
MSANPVPLEFMKPEDRGVVVDMAGDPCHLKRLQEIGLQVGCSVRMVCPGKPCMICVEGRRLSLRLDEKAEIFVATEDGPRS